MFPFCRGTSRGFREVNDWLQVPRLVSSYPGTHGPVYGLRVGCSNTSLLSSACLGPEEMVRDLGCPCRLTGLWMCSTGPLSQVTLLSVSDNERSLSIGGPLCALVEARHGHGACVWGVRHAEVMGHAYEESCDEPSSQEVFHLLAISQFPFLSCGADELRPQF